MAKQFGVGDAALAGLEDPECFPFPPAEKAALRYAEAMTRGTGEVPDPIFRDLRAHYDERQIVEITAVIGLFNYFNRYNNALHMDITLMDPGVLVERLARAAAGGADPPALAQQAVGLLHQGRRCLRVAIYRGEGAGLAREAWRGADPPERLRAAEADPGPPPLPSTRARLTARVATQSGTPGLIVMESDRPDAFGEEDRLLLQRVAAILGEGPGAGGRNAPG